MTDTAAARPAPGPILRVLKPLASLKLTVILLVMAVVIVFAGTLAQVDDGLWTVLRTYFRSMFVMIPFKIFFPRSWEVPGTFPFPGGWLIGGVLFVNLLAAHAVRFKLSWARSGILLTHAGLVVLLLSEFVTGLFAVEGNMSIDVGASSNYIEQSRVIELAVVNPEDPATDEVTALPEALLRSKAMVSDASLPFDLQVDAYYVNSRIMPAPKTPGANPATAGEGLHLLATRAPEVSGAGADQTVDLSSAYVTIREKPSGRALGTWLVALTLGPQEVLVDGHVRTIALRFRRTYKPYRLHLKEFRHDLYPGTQTPKNFSSRVQIVDPSRGVDREVLIYMNNPLRYEGETFFQASFRPDDGGTVLQVVRNPGWLMPYVSCILVSVGLVVQFLISLGKFLKKKRAAQQAVEGPRKIGVPAIVTAALALAYVLLSMLPPRDSGDDLRLHDFSRLPAIHGGRVKPLDTLARNALMAVSGRQTYTDEKGATQPAIRWMLDVMTGPFREEAPDRKLKVFRIENDQVLAAAGLTARPGFRYALEEFAPKIQELQRMAQRAHDKPAGDRDLFDEKIVELAEKLHVYLQLAQMTTPHLVPPRVAGGEWRTLARATAEPLGDDAPLRSLVTMIGAYGAGNAVTFNSELASYDAWLAKARPENVRATRFEAWFNAFEPFYRCSVLYLIVFLLVCFSFLGAAGPLRSSAFMLTLLTLALHTFALLARMVIQERPFVFVTNLYSSAIFIGWAGAVLGLVLEWFHRNGTGLLMASVKGFLTLLVAHSLAAKGDTLEVMQAVLDTNFWLATHVTCVTLGYAATFLAGKLGIIFVLGSIFSRSFHDEKARVLSRMIYGIICFAMLFSFVGTVLGGIWADQSWGRFWGWDPKENGALIIVLWNALILHARWGGIVQARGIAVLAVVGNIVTAWSWFGVNMLGVGLHSYGFMGSAVFWLLLYVASQLLVIIAGLLPLRSWKPAPAAPVAAAAP